MTAQAEINKDTQVVDSTPPKPSLGVNPFRNSAMLFDIIKQAELTTMADVKVLHFVASTQLPCHWESAILAIVPDSGFYPALQQIWTILRDPVRNELSSLPTSSSVDIHLECNSATTIEKLLEDEKNGAILFLETCQLIARYSGGKLHFGPQNINMTKSEPSIRSKVERMQTESGCTPAQAIAQIDDGVRGTISFENPSQLKQGIKAFMQLAANRGWKVHYSNLWENEKDYGGYLDVDARIVIPLDGGRQVIAELQFHLDDFYDGTTVSPVSRAHKVYDQMRMIPVTGKSESNLSYEELNETSRLFFTTALFQGRRH